MPVIIVEGIDGSGKSTLVDSLESMIPDNYHVLRMHRGPIQDTVENEYIEPLTSLSSNQFLLADRWHVGEMIYGPIYRGESLVSGLYENLIESYLDSIGAVKIILQPDISEVRQRLADRGEDYLLEEHVEEVYKFYGQYADKHNYLVVLDNDYVDVDEIIEMAMEGRK